MSDIAVYKLPLIMLSHGCWDHAACVALLMADSSLEEAQAVMNAALLGARQTDAASDAMHTAPPQPEKGSSSISLVNGSAQTVKVPLQQPASSSEVTADAFVDAATYAVQTGALGSLVIHLQKVNCTRQTHTVV